MKNIFYFYNINSIGGVESMFYYLAKKYCDKDIVVLYTYGDEKQIARLEQYVEVRKYNNEKIRCEKAFFNYNVNIINNIEAKDYYLIVHADYKALGIKPLTHPKINHYIGVSKLACQAYEEVGGVECELCYNPILIDKPKRILHLVSATRLTYEKGKNRMIKLMKLLDENKIPYEWTIYTNDTDAIKNPHIIYKKPSLNIIDYINDADYLVQLSDNEGYCYSIVEALMCGTGVICTPCPVFEEIGLVNGENCFYCDFEMKNVPIKEIYETELNFKYTPKEDNWNNLLAPGPSPYQEDFKYKFYVKATEKYEKEYCKDSLLDRIPQPGETWWVEDVKRFKKLYNLGYVTLIKKELK